jgi:hypothetical protein
MYLWSVKALAEDFREQRVSQHEQFKYALTYGIMLSLLFSSIAYMPATQPSVASFSCDLADLVAAVLGTVACYRVNRSGDDKDFLVRLYCLGLPVGISTLAVAAICLVPLIVLPDAAGFPISGESLDVLGLVVVIGVYYWRLWHWTRFVAHSGSGLVAGGMRYR